MIIKCIECSAIIGEIRKEGVTQEDLDMYQQMFTCECGANAAVENSSEDSP